MPKMKDLPKGYAERLDSIEAKIRQLTFEKDRALKRFHRKFGDKAAAIHELQEKIRRQIDAETEPEDVGIGYGYKDGELFLRKWISVSDEVKTLNEQLRQLRGEAPTVRWKPGWRCECGNNTSIWFAPNGRTRYAISCEDCWADLGFGSEEEMYAEVHRDLAMDVISLPERNKLKSPHKMFLKEISEKIGVDMRDLPPFIGMRGRTVEYYLEKFKNLPRQIAERQAEEEEDLPEVEKWRLFLVDRKPDRMGGR